MKDSFSLEEKKKEKKKTEKLKLIMNSYDVSLLEYCVKIITKRLIQLKIPFINPIPLPTKRTLISLPTSPHRYKYSQEQFEKTIHRRAIFINEISKQDMENINKLRTPEMVNII